MKQSLTFAFFTILLFSACQKDTHSLPGAAEAAQTVLTSSMDRGTVATTFTRYLIRKGNHYCDQNTIKSVSTSEMKFTAKFNSSAIYTTIDPVNQYDINKLWGFSEGLNHQYNSARIGWSYNNSALRLYGYVYSKGVRYSQEICTVNLNTEILCGIKLSGSNYLITANGITVTLPRGLSTTRASGYQLYPYFGGDETAPQDITIDIK
jgi:hypothetical protein